MDSMEQIIMQLSRELSVSPEQVRRTVELIDGGNTIPFIARYRKERTGGLSDETLRSLSDRLTYLRNLQSRREEIRRLIEEQEKMTPALDKDIDAAATLTELEDLYRPFRPKRRTRATIAREKGLAPLAERLLAQSPDAPSPEILAQDFVNASQDVQTPQDALSGAMDIIAEEISDNSEFRRMLRSLTLHNASLVSKNTKEEDSVYRLYYDFSEPLRKLAPHRLLAVNRGEKEGWLSVKIDMDEEICIRYLLQKLIPKKQSAASALVAQAAQDSYRRLIAPSVASELRSLLTDEAGEASIQIFRKNLSGLLLQPPIKGKTVLGVDPGYRTGCKLAVVDETGKVLDTGVAYFTLPHHDQEKAEKQIAGMIQRHGVTLISIGNGTASKESEIFIAKLIARLDREISYIMTNEAGASVYSASKLAAEEFPEYDVALRSAVSIARRAQDPLAELVKIDPKSIGVGQYQHDMNQKRLGEALGGVVEDCVNSVGVDLNTASPSLLSYVAGINKTTARNIALYREEQGAFQSRGELLKVPKLGKKAFEQCAGFLRIPGAGDFLDNTSVHPESYQAARKLLSLLGYTPEDAAQGRVGDIKARLKEQGAEALSQKLGIGVPTLLDIADSLLKKGRDPREDLPQPVLRTDVMGMEDLKPGMIFSGTVRNVIDFGAFVDIGVHQDGLVHISQICSRYIKHPTEVLNVGDVVKVKVLSVEPEKKRISLTMKDL